MPVAAQTWLTCKVVRTIVYNKDANKCIQRALLVALEAVGVVGGTGHQMRPDQRQHFLPAQVWTQLLGPTAVSAFWIIRNTIPTEARPSRRRHPASVDEDVRELCGKKNYCPYRSE